jgi:hypothetical protein
MSNTSRQTIIDLFESAFKELIKSYSGAEPELVVGEAKTLPNSSATIVGFGDIYFSGTAVLVGASDATSALADTAPSNPVDWLGELTNQLVGRLKNKLTIFGVLPAVGMPVPVSCPSLGLHSGDSEPLVWQAAWPGGVLQMSLSLNIDSELELTAQQGMAAAAPEGSLSLF